MYHEVQLGNAKICLKSNTPEEAIAKFINNGPPRMIDEGTMFNVQEV